MKGAMPFDQIAFSSMHEMGGMELEWGKTF